MIPRQSLAKVKGEDRSWSPEKNKVTGPLPCSPPRSSLLQRDFLPETWPQPQGQSCLVFLKS